MIIYWYLDDIALSPEQFFEIDLEYSLTAPVISMHPVVTLEISQMS